MVATSLTLSTQQFREFEDCAIALHDALKQVGDFDGRELLDCIRQRFERAILDVQRGQRSCEAEDTAHDAGAEGGEHA